VVDSELRPGHDLAELIERSESAGQGDEPIGGVLHRGLALMHRAGDPQLGEAVVPDLLVPQRLGDDPEYLAAGRQRAIRHNAHQPDPASPVDETDPAAGDLLAEPFCCLPVGE